MSDPASLQELVLSRPGLLRYWPLDATNLGAELVAGDNAMAQGGVVLGGATGAGDAMTATDLDGVDDRVTTPYGTRRNVVRNPRLLTFTAWSTSGTAAGTVAGSTDVAPPLPGQGAGELAKLVPSGTNCSLLHSATNPTQWEPCNPGDTFTVSFYVYGALTNAADRNAKAALRWMDASNVVLSETAGIVTLAPRGAWTRYTLTAVAPANAAFVSGRYYGVGSSGVAGEIFYVSAPLLEKSGSVGDYFAGGTGPDTAWEGTVDNSVSSKGVFANGSVRTFAGWANRDDTAAIHALMGGDDFQGVAPQLYLLSGSEDVRLDINRVDGTSISRTTWTGAWPGTAQYISWMCVFNEPNDTANLLINGVSAGVKTGLTKQWGNYQALVLGARSTALYFNGKIAHYAVYDGDRSSYALDDWSWGLSTAASRAPTFGLPSAANFPSPANLPTGESLGQP